MQITAKQSVTVRFRVAKITPTKSGQFVVFWEKGADNQNQAFADEQSPDVLVVQVFHPATKESGQFVFPKEILVKQGVLSTATTKGKMAMRVYPDWDQPESRHAIATQKWQQDYFFRINVSEKDAGSVEGWKRLYNRQKTAKARDMRI